MRNIKYKSNLDNLIWKRRENSALRFRKCNYTNLDLTTKVVPLLCENDDGDNIRPRHHDLIYREPYSCFRRGGD